MKDNGVKTTGDEFLWSQADCDRMGIDRELARLAWRVLSTGNEKDAYASITLSGYDRQLSFAQISALPSYAQAMRVMSVQYVNAVISPMAIRALATVAGDTSAAPAARVTAASKILDHAAASLDRLTAGTQRSLEDLDLDALAALIDDIESRRAAGAKPVVDVQTSGQLAEDDSYLSEFLE